MNDARMHGVTGVPFVVINGKWAISGAQTADVYYQVRFPRCFPRRSLTPRRAADLPEARALLQDRRVQHRRGAREEDHADRGRADVRQADVEHGRDRVRVGLRMSAAAARRPCPCRALPCLRRAAAPLDKEFRDHAPRMTVFPACCSPRAIHALLPLVVALCAYLSDHALLYGFLCCDDTLSAEHGRRIDRLCHPGLAICQAISNLPGVVSSTGTKFVSAVSGGSLRKQVQGHENVIGPFQGVVSTYSGAWWTLLR
jgi:hypothetical protein